MNTWNLDKLYKSFESEEFQSDLKHLDDLILKMKGFESQLHDYEGVREKLISYVENSIALSQLAERLFSYASLRRSTESTNVQSLKYLNLLQVKVTELTTVETMFKKWLKDVPGLEKVIEEDPLLEEHRFHFVEQKSQALHLLDDKTEVLIAKLRQSGSIAWNHLQSLLTSTLAVDYEGKEITLSEVRNLAYEADPKVREKAFAAEIKAYEKIEKAIAAAINSIKGEVNTLTEARGYESPLAETLIKSRMKKDTLDVMIETMEAYLPVFRKYLKRKAKLLGHKNGLPFYDLFAPIGNASKSFTIPEANEYILKNFHTFNERLYQMANKAFKDGWIDYLPKKGKVGGAFCANLHVIKESRVLTNFNGAFGDVITMAHELGHAYHGEAIFDESPLNSDYTMPVAETASTFCETIVNQAALKDATTTDEKLYLLESSLQDATQVIVDILSRFYFEKALFEGRKTTLYDADELKSMMLDAQKKSYGDGLDENKLHPYMWVCKSHYYSGTLSYYNFPYAFGLLFAKGLYAKYLENKETFVPMYDKLLAATGKNFVEDAAMIANIDVTDKAFWVGSLELLKADIDLFLKLTE
ncbi:MAG: M3 family oligoendopeptidase [Candidatus Izemoplasmatales bacterium]|nr:M3 family oligoendopeptidase [Candidatus Izemoplasmatales bacterium]